MTAAHAGAWIDIYVIPPTAADRHDIQVFSLAKGVEQPWEKRVLHEIDGVLAGRPMR